MQKNKAMPAEIIMPQWHALELEAVFKQLGTSGAGLDSASAEKRLDEHGHNTLPEPEETSMPRRFLRQFHNILIYVLLGAALVTIVLGHIPDAVVILAVVCANALIGFIQEGKAEKAIDAIRHMLAPVAAVMRDGQLQKIPAEMLVPGDIILLEAGDKIPADVRLVQAHGLLVQEAILTGESLPVEKTTGSVTADASIGDRTCMGFSGTIVASGQAKGLVVATGAHTEIGKISSLLSTVKNLTTPLIEQMNVFSKWLTLVILLVSVLLLAFGLFMQQQPFADIFMAVVGLAVAAIPEGMPAVLTITLAIGVQVMARRNAIIRRLPAIETLGAVSVICTDKTGTLTRNEMMVTTVVTATQGFSVSGSGYEPEGLIQYEGRTLTEAEMPRLDDIARAACLCNDAVLQAEQGMWTVLGDPMEGALLSFAQKAGLDEHAEHKTWSRTDMIPFDAGHRYMATLNHNHQRQAFVFVKGAPEQLLEMCSLQRMESGSDEPLNRPFWLQHIEAVAMQGQRVLALALKAMPPEHVVLESADVDNSLVLLGLVGLIDPPRPESVKAIAECTSAGIRVKMITGDHAGTAAAIARQIGLTNTGSVLSGADIDKLDDAALSRAVMDTDIFARTSPGHKLRLVMSLQANNLIVAMTGDGVNDAPALKRADVGIAMGKKGSEAARESAAIVLMDDNFASIVAAVREGRTVYNNIQKVISWILPTNAGEALTIIVAILLGMTMPITPIQILWINLITDATLGIALAFEPSDARTMLRPPRQRQESLLSKNLVWRIVFASLLFTAGVFGVYRYALEQQYSIEHARTMVVNTLVVMQIFYLFYIRNLFVQGMRWSNLRGTPVLWLTIAIILAGQSAITFFPPLQKIFATTAIGVMDAVLITGIGFVLLLIVEAEQLLHKYLPDIKKGHR